MVGVGDSAQWCFRARNKDWQRVIPRSALGVKERDSHDMLACLLAGIQKLVEAECISIHDEEA